MSSCLKFLSFLMVLILPQALYAGPKDEKKVADFIYGPYGFHSLARVYAQFFELQLTLTYTRAAMARAPEKMTEADERALIAVDQKVKYMVDDGFDAASDSFFDFAELQTELRQMHSWLTPEDVKFIGEQKYLFFKDLEHGTFLDEKSYGQEKEKHLARLVSVIKDLGGQDINDPKAQHKAFQDLIETAREMRVLVLTAPSVKKQLKETWEEWGLGYLNNESSVLRFKPLRNFLTLAAFAVSGFTGGGLSYMFLRAAPYGMEISLAAGTASAFTVLFTAMKAFSNIDLWVAGENGIDRRQDLRRFRAQQLGIRVMEEMGSIAQDISHELEHYLATFPGNDKSQKILQEIIKDLKSFSHPCGMEGVLGRSLLSGITG